MRQLRRNRQHTCALLISVVACLAVSAAAQSVPWQSRARPAGNPAAQVSPDEATLTIWNRPIVTFRMTLAGRSPRARAAGAAQRLSELPTEVLARGVYATNFTWESYRGIVVSVGGVPVFRVFEGDLDPDSGETLEMVSERAAGRLREAVAAYLELREWKRLLRGALLAVLATMLFALAVWLIRRSRTWLTERLVALPRRSR